MRGGESLSAVSLHICRLPPASPQTKRTQGGGFSSSLSWVTSFLHLERAHWTWTTILVSGRRQWTHLHFISACSHKPASTDNNQILPSTIPPTFWKWCLPSAFWHVLEILGRLQTSERHHTAFHFFRLLVSTAPLHLHQIKLGQYASMHCRWFCYWEGARRHKLSCFGGNCDLKIWSSKRTCRCENGKKKRETDRLASMHELRVCEQSNNIDQLSVGVWTMFLQWNLINIPHGWSQPTPLIFWKTADKEQLHQNRVTLW